MTLDLHTVKEDFAVMVQKVQPWTLSQFVMWLDLKVAEYKVHGYMILDYEEHLNQLFATESQKSLLKNGPFTNTATAPVRTAPSRNIAKPTSVINIDADSPPPPPTALAQNTITHRNSNTKVIDVDVTKSSSSNSQNIHAIFARTSQPVDSNISIANVSPPLMVYSQSKNVANSPASQYTSHNGQHIINSNSLRTSLAHSRLYNSNHSHLVKYDQAIILGGSRGSSTSSRSNGVVTFSQHSQQTNAARGYLSGEQAYPNQLPVQRIDIDAEQELNQVQVEPQMELLMDFECESDDYGAENWNSPAVSSSSNKDKRLLHSSIGIKNGHYGQSVGDTDSKISNDVEAINDCPVTEIKLEDVKHCTEDESLALNIENSNSCNRLLSGSDECFRINDSDSDIECDNNPESLQDGFNDHIWSSEESGREASNLSQSGSKRRYMNQRIKPIISLPLFNGYLQNMLESGKAQFVWSKLVEQCAYHILAQKDIREKHDYREFCHALYQRYPSIGLEGPQPWSHFSKTLSQKIRHIRWQHKKRTTEVQKGVPPPSFPPTAHTSTSMTAIPFTNTDSAPTPAYNPNSVGPSGSNNLLLLQNEIKEDITCTTATTQMVKKCEEV